MKVVIIEDEEAARERLKIQLKQIDSSIDVVKEIESVESAVAWLEKNKAVDLIFMDVELADGQCFHIFDKTEVKTPVIFTTAYHEFAINAFKVNSVDYLLKPLKLAELEKSIHKFKVNFGRINPAHLPYDELAKLVNPKHSSLRKRFLIKLGEHLVSVEVREVAYFFSEEKITFLVTKENKKYPLDQSLDQLETELPGEKFFRINRQYLVNIDAINKMVAYSKGRVKLDLVPPSRHETIVSVERSAEFKQWLQ